MTTYSPIYQSVHREVLENGLTTLIVSPDKRTRTVAAYLAVKTGAADEGKWLGAGLSHFVEHMFFKGTSERSKGMIEKEVRRIGGDINAYTSHDLTVFHVTGLASEVDTAINLLYDAAFHSVLDPEEMNREREVIVSEMRMNEDRLDRKTLLTLWNRMYTGHPYENPVIGYESVFRSSTREDLKAFMDEYYVPNNMVLSVVGDVDPDHVSDYIKQTFGSVARKSINPVYRTQPIAQQSRRFTSVQKPAQHIRFMIGFPTPPAGHADAPALDVLAEIFGGGDDSRLVQQVKEREQLVVDTGAFHSALKDGGVFAVDATVTVEKYESALNSINSRLDTLISSGVTQEEVDRAVTQILSQHYQSIETNASIAHELLFNEIVMGDFSFTQSYLSQLQKLKAADIQMAAKKYLIENKRNQVELIPPSAASARRKTERSEVKGIPDFKIQKRTLQNGIRILSDEDHSNPLIQVQVAFLGGVLFESEQVNGVSTVIADMLTRGTGKLTQSDIAMKFAEWGGAVSSYSGRNSFGLTLTFLKKYESEALNLLSEMLLNPSWDADEFTKVRNESMEDLNSQKEEIFSTATFEFHKMMYDADHPYSLNPIGNEQSLSALTAEKAYDFYLRLRNPNSMVIGVAGPIDPNGIEKLLNKSLGRMTAPQYAAEPRTDGHLLPADSRTHFMEREQAVVMIGFPAVAIQHQDRYPLEVLNAVLSGSAGKLYQFIRGEHGLSYVVGSSLSLGIVPGHFLTYAATAPNESQKVKALLSTLLTGIAESGCSAEELELAKAQLSGHHLHALETKSSRLSLLVSEELLGSGWEAVFEYPANIDAIDEAVVQRVFGQYLLPAEQHILLTGNAEATGQND